MAYSNEPTRAPDLEGRGGRAWRVTASAEGRTHAGVGTDWLVCSPRSHPFWWYYMVSAIHLRPLEGVDPPVISREGATHEVVVLAMNPEKPLPDVDHWESMAYLTPPDVARQFTVGNDEQAKELGDLVVRHICEGMSPDQDFRSYWNDAIDRTAEHIRTGGHPA